MKKLEKISITAIASLAVLGTTVFGATGKVYNTSQGLVLRGEASKSGAPLATIANDAEVEIIEKTGEWYKVNANGKEGYLFAEYVEVQEESEEEPTENTEQPVTNNQEIPDNTTKQETKIYIVPVITSSVIGTIPEGTEVNTEKTLNNWAYVSFGEIRGWIRTASYNAAVVPEKPQEEAPEVAPEENPVETPEAPQEQENVQVPEQPTENTNLSFTKGYINSESVNVRRGPSTDTEIVTNLILNTGVRIIAQTDEWYRLCSHRRLYWRWSESAFCQKLHTQKQRQEPRRSNKECCLPLLNQTCALLPINPAQRFCQYRPAFRKKAPGGTIPHAAPDGWEREPSGSHSAQSPLQWLKPEESPAVMTTPRWSCYPRPDSQS